MSLELVGNTLDEHIAENQAIKVLDKGYVRLVDYMGSDLSVANAARASYAKESLEFTDSDARLIGFLAREGHMSPFRHAFMTLEFYAPLMIARQHWKYVTGSDHTMDSWNESSRRYISMEPEFYVPSEKDGWRLAPDGGHQGSGANMGPAGCSRLTGALIDHYDTSMELYERALSMGACAEQARLFLPAYGMYVAYRWSCSLQSMSLFLSQRLSEGAQAEITQFAEAVYELVLPKYPVSLGKLVTR